MKPHLRTICKANKFISENGKFEYHHHLVIGQLYEFYIDDNGYNLLVDGNIRGGNGYIFFVDQPAFDVFNFKLFFMSREEMRNINIDLIINK